MCDSSRHSTLPISSWTAVITSVISGFVMKPSRNIFFLLNVEGTYEIFLEFNLKSSQSFIIQDERIIIHTIIDIIQLEHPRQFIIKSASLQGRQVGDEFLFDLKIARLFFAMINQRSCERLAVLGNQERGVHQFILAQWLGNIFQSFERMWQEHFRKIVFKPKSKY